MTENESITRSDAGQSGTESPVESPVSVPALSGPEAPTSVYVMLSEGRFKIGMAANAEKRLRQVRNAGGAEVTLFAWRVFGTRLSAQHVEANLHRKFSRQRTVGEWFRGDASKAAAALMAVSDPQLHMDDWHPDMPPEVAMGSALEKHTWHRRNGSVASRKLDRQLRGLAFTL